MSTAQWKTGQVESLLSPNVEDALSHADSAFERGAESVAIYKTPHNFRGLLRRCELCGGLMEDEVLHGVD